MAQIYCVYYNNIHLMNGRIVGYYTDLNIAEKHLKKIGKIYREKKVYCTLYIRYKTISSENLTQK